MHLFLLSVRLTAYDAEYPYTQYGSEALVFLAAPGPGLASYPYHPLFNKWLFNIFYFSFWLFSLLFQMGTLCFSVWHPWCWSRGSWRGWRSRGAGWRQWMRRGRTLRRTWRWWRWAWVTTTTISPCCTLTRAFGCHTEPSTSWFLQCFSLEPWTTFQHPPRPPPAHITMFLHPWTKAESSPQVALQNRHI
jgi:hypothetical protein